MSSTGTSPSESLKFFLDLEATGYEDLNDEDIIIFSIGFGYSLLGGVLKSEHLKLEGISVNSVNSVDSVDSVDSQKKLMLSLLASIESNIKYYYSLGYKQDMFPIFHWGPFEKIIFERVIKKLDIDLGYLNDKLRFQSLERFHFKK